MIMMVTLLGLAVGCAERIPAMPTPFRNAEFLSKPDLALQIPGLRPCTEAADSTIHLNSQQPVTILVHGCNGSAGRFQALAEVFAFHGQQTVGFTYDDRDEMMATSGALARAIEALGARMQNKQITIVGHSQGGLVARKALVAGRPDALRDPELRIRLVTISTPFSGIRAARHCGSPVARIISLGMVMPICQIVTGSKWREITYNAPFITRPGQLSPQVKSHLKVNTDERDSCRTVDAEGNCLKSDFTFSLEEQNQPEVDREPRLKRLDVKAGHVEIVGDRQVIPEKLIRILQQEGVMATTRPERHVDLAKLLAKLYLEDYGTGARE